MAAASLQPSSVKKMRASNIYIYMRQRPVAKWMRDGMIEWLLGHNVAITGECTEWFSFSSLPKGLVYPPGKQLPLINSYALQSRPSTSPFLPGFPAVANSRGVGDIVVNDTVVMKARAPRWRRLSQHPALWQKKLTGS